MKRPFILAAGGLNLDLCGVPAGNFRLRDSNPGRVRWSAGGVAHNIARRLAKAGARVELVTVLGDDGAARFLEDACKSEGVGLAHVVRARGASSVYLCIHDEQGDMVAAVNDMDILAFLTPERLPKPSGTSLVVADANLPRETLEALVRLCDAPVLLDPVSAAKAGRARGVLKKLSAITPNLPEAEALTGEPDPARAAERLLEMGVRQVYVTLGAEGVHYADQSERGHLPAAPLRIKSATGAGDAFASGVALGMLARENARACALRGLESAHKHLMEQGGISI